MLFCPTLYRDCEIYQNLRWTKLLSSPLLFLLFPGLPSLFFHPLPSLPFLPLKVGPLNPDIGSGRAL